jgi:predicted phosphodiesterase
MSRVLVVGDVHLPVSHPAYLRFCMDLRDKHRCNSVVFIGDILDHHAISFHAHHPNAPGPDDESELAHQCIEKWVEEFPTASVCVGNHDARVIRLAETVNIPARFIRDYAEVWGTPKWNWQDEHKIDDVLYFHGVGCGGLHPAYNAMKKVLMSTVIGHVHSAGGVKWAANPDRRIFAMDVGCGIDDRAVAFAYGRASKVRSILSAGVVIDGVPVHEIMPCGPGERYHRSRFKHSRLIQKGVSK